MQNKRYCTNCQTYVPCSFQVDGQLACDECSRLTTLHLEAPAPLALTDDTDPAGLLRNLREMGASDTVLALFGQMHPEAVGEIVLFIADFGQNLVREDREKRANKPALTDLLNIAFRKSS